MSPEWGELLADWLPAQRWYGAKGRPIHRITVREVAAVDGLPEAAEATLHWLLVRVDLDGGEQQTYQVPVSLRPDRRPEFEHATIGRLEGAIALDGLGDPAVTALLIDWLRTGASVGTLRCTAPDGVDLPAGVGLPLAAEQSNTSLVYGASAILKVFRRLAPGLNPDLEVTRALAATGSPHVAAPLGWISGEFDGEATTYGLLQTFLKNGSEGWKMATASVRDLLAEADLHADEVGGDFGGEAARLGQATAEVHDQLAEALGSEPASEQVVAERVDVMLARLLGASRIVPELEPHVGAIRRALERVREAAVGVRIQRVHGDYHLGQVMRTQQGWVVLDFEGEPARPLAERRGRMSPLRDVAGMLRSFDYAARSELVDRPGLPQLTYRAGEWVERNRAAFCEGYAAGSARDPREDAVLLRAFELDKAVYEVVYEARNRPGWLGIPLGSIARITGQDD